MHILTHRMHIYFSDAYVKSVLIEFVWLRKAINNQYYKL
jgi:hypothetical protein